MNLRHRPMRPKDISECVELVASHPVAGPRYGSQIDNLGRAWLRILGCEAKAALVFEDVDGPRARIVAVGVSVFVRDRFVQELKTPPLFWFGAELTKRVLRGDSPLLSDIELREANSTRRRKPARMGSLRSPRGCGATGDLHANGCCIRRRASRFLLEGDHRGAGGHPGAARKQLQNRRLGLEPNGPTMGPLVG